MHLVCRLLLEKNFFNDTATTEIYTLSLHDALPICSIMNVCFVMNDEYKDLEDEFIKFATSKGMVGIKEIGRAHV